MPRKTRKAELAQRQNPTPMMFDEDDLPTRPEVLQSVKAGHYKHTGARLLENDALALRVVELLMMQVGLKQIARRLGVSKHTVRAAREELVRRGELAPYKERIVRRMEDIIEVGSANYLKALEDGTVPAAQIPVGVGIFSDKRALAMGEPTAISVVGQAALPAENLSVEKLNAWVEALPTDSPSDETRPQPKQIEG